MRGRVEREGKGEKEWREGIGEGGREMRGRVERGDEGESGEGG